MEIRFNINEDAEFKGEIKKLIQSELKSLVRHEVIEAAKEELKLKLNSSSIEHTIKMVLKECIQDRITAYKLIEEVVNPYLGKYLESKVDSICEKNLSNKQLLNMIEQEVKRRIIKEIS